MLTIWLAIYTGPLAQSLDHSASSLAMSCTYDSDKPASSPCTKPQGWHKPLAFLGLSLVPSPPPPHPSSPSCGLVHICYCTLSHMRDSVGLHPFVQRPNPDEPRQHTQTLTLTHRHINRRNPLHFRHVPLLTSEDGEGDMKCSSSPQMSTATARVEENVLKAVL